MFGSPKFESIAPGERKKNNDPSIDRLRLLMGTQLGKVEVKGVENIAGIPEGKKVVLVTTHLSDRDVPITIAYLGNELYSDVVWGEASTHESIRENPGGFLGRKIAGQRHSISVSTKKTDGMEKGVFNPDDFEPMKAALDEGKSAILAAYYKAGEGWNLPDRGGYGAVLLAQNPDTVLVPVAVNTKSKEQTGMGASPIKAIMKRPDVDVLVGKPFELAAIQGAERIGELMRARKERKLTPEEIREFGALSESLRNESDEVMMHLAELLPEEKQGAWARKLAEKK